MKTLLQIFILVITAAFMSSCSGNDGDPGPTGKDGAQGAKGDKGDKGDQGGQGEQGENGEALLKSGSISGTFSGTRRNKTAFQETFKYEYLGDEDGFNNDGVLSVSRQTENFGRSGYVAIQIAFTEKNNPALPMYISYLSLGFTKEITPSQLFTFGATTSSESPDPATVQYPLSIENNDKYQIDYSRAFRTTKDGIVYYGALTDDNSFVFYTLDSKVVHYENGGVTVGDYKKVALLKVTDAAGNEIDPGVFEGTSFYYKAVGPGSYIEDEDSNDLSGQEIWDFSETVTNYHYNAATGIVTFDYSIDIPAPLNSSGHVATLSGSAEVKVYEEIASRIAADN